MDLSKMDLKFTDDDGEVRPLSHWLNKGRPIILSLVYFDCPSLCSLHLNGVFEGLEKLSFKPGEDYTLLAVSFAPGETYDLAAAKKVTYLERYKLPLDSGGVHFLTGDENHVKKLAESVGFTYKWVESSKEWAHASAAILITPEGVISRYLHGVYFEPKTFRLSLVEASKGMIGDIIDQVVLFCFRYDPKGSQYAIYAYNVVRVGAALIVIVMLIWMLPVWLRERKRGEG